MKWTNNMSRSLPETSRLPEATSATAELEDRRREPRHEASGTAILTVDGTPAWRIEGVLIDTSEGGFRLEHSHGGLTTGTEVRFAFHGRTGRAKVCWNRIANGRVESGFYVTSQRKSR
jgi:hypothetical protein